MRYKHFTNANVDVSALAVGTWAIGGQNYGAVDRSDSIKAIHAMLDQGVNLIDTAPCYGNGASEKIVGEALAAVPRENVLGFHQVRVCCPSVYSGAYKKVATYKSIMSEDGKLSDESEYRLHRLLLCALAGCEHAHRRDDGGAVHAEEGRERSALWACPTSPRSRLRTLRSICRSTCSSLRSPW